MDTRPEHRRRIAPGVLAGALLLVPLAGCGDSGGDDAAPGATATASAPTEETTAPSGTAEPGATGSDGGTSADVDCAGTSCSVTLTGDGAQTEVLGTSIALGTVEGGRATVRVGDQELACGEGESVSAGPLTLACTTVTEDTLTLTASLG